MNIIKLNYQDRIRNLDIETQGEVKSKKYFPVFNIDNKEYIFKPLSKSKPFCNPSFALSEVFWSNVINKYFDSSAPIYRLGICNGYEKEENKYRNQGTLVPSIINKDEKLVNLLEYFRLNSDSNVDIDKYINYCGKFYDYTDIFNSKLIRNNSVLGEKLANQVLISILKGDINYHYENVNFIYKDNELLKLAPPIDHEFSVHFLFPDINLLTKVNVKSIIKVLDTEEVSEEFGEPFISNKQALLDNINLISHRYPTIVKSFVNNLNSFINDIDSLKFTINKDYLYPFSSFDFEDFKNEHYFSKLFKTDRNYILEDNYSDVVLGYIYDTSISLSKILNKKLKINSKLILENGKI